MIGVSRPLYVIISDTDAPQPNMVCQWVDGAGYCYLDRKYPKKRYDGMQGAEATCVSAFGWCWVHTPDGRVEFYRDGTPVTATYSDGKPRKWSGSTDSFQHPRLMRLGGKVKASRAPPLAESSDYEEVLADHRALVRRLDIALNGEEGAAKQASLCDIVSQVEDGRWRLVRVEP